MTRIQNRILLFPLVLTLSSGPGVDNYPIPLVNETISRLLIVPVGTALKYPKAQFAGGFYNEKDTPIAKTVSQIQYLNRQFNTRYRLIAVRPHTFLSHVEYIRPLVAKRTTLQKFLKKYAIRHGVEKTAADTEAGKGNPET